MIARACLLAYPLCPAQSSDVVYDTLPSLLQNGISAFEAGDYPSASSNFLRIQEVYSNEPDWVGTDLPRRILPLSGFASLKAHRYDESLLAFELFLENYADTPEQESFGLFLKAKAHAGADQIESAINLYRKLNDVAKGQDLKAIANLGAARLLHANSQTDDAIALLQENGKQTKSPLLSTQSRLLAIRYLLDSESAQHAANLLLESPWEIASMPEIAMLSFLAMEIGDSLMERNKFTEALLAYQQVLPRSELVRQQQLKLSALETRFKARRQQLSLQQSLWGDFYKEVIASLRHQLSILESSPDYFNQIQTRKAICFLQLNRPIEASLIAQSLVSSDGETLAAYKIWIRSLRRIGQYRNAITVANRFISESDANQEINQIIYEIGLAQLDSKQYSPAFESFQSLLKSSPQDSLRHASIYQSGLCLAFAEDYKAASFQFETLSKQQMADAYLRGQAAIWHGLCHFFQNDFERALHIFDHVSYSSLPASIKTEAQFRRITCLYPLQRLEKAKESASRFLNAHPSHTRAPEAQLLLGDIYFDTEDPLEALEAYKKVHPDFPDLYSEAQLSASEALLALNDVSEAKKLLENAISHIHSSALAGPLYLQRVDISQDDVERKYVIKKWIRDHGNNKEAKLALPILEGLDGKEEAIEKAYQSQQLTLASRLLLAKSLALGRRGQPHQAELSLLKIQETIPPASLPPECKAYLGLSLAKLGLPHGIELLEDFLAKHPRNENVPIAYWGLGLVAFEKENFEEAESWFKLAKDSVFPFPYESEASLLEGISLHNQNRFEQGNATLNQLLANRSTPAKVKAKALNALAKGAARKDQRKEAIAYFQRSFALYPAFYDTAIEAYLESASLFAKIEDHEAAINTCQELLQRYEGLPPEERTKAAKIIEASKKSKRASLASLDE